MTRHAHGWFAQMLADFGLVGLALTTLLFLTWAMAALSATGLLPRRLLRGADEERVPLRRDWDAHRIALVTVLLVPVVFGVQSLLDWTWFIPAPAVMALIAAGYVAGRGPLGSEDEEGAATGPVFTRRPTWGRILAGVAAVATAALIAWAAWQPEASDHATNDALALADKKKFDAAVERTKDAEDINPLTPDPLLVRASIDTQANRVRDAEHSLQQAVISFPGDPQTWYRLAAFQLGTLDAPEAAIKTIRGALYLDPHSQSGQPAVPERPRAAPREERPDEPEPARSGLAGRPREQRPGAALERADVEAELAEQPGERPAREEAEVRRQRIRRAHEPPRRRRRDRERAARPEHAPRLGEEQLDVAHVLERLGEEDEIELAVAERKRRVRLELDQPRVRQPGARAAERQRGHVGGGELAGVQVGRQAAVATAEVERAVRASERAHELAQMRRRRPGVLGHELPQLVVVAAASRRRFRRPERRELGGQVGRLHLEDLDRLGKSPEPPGADAPGVDRRGQRRAHRRRQDRLAAVSGEADARRRVNRQPHVSAVRELRAPSVQPDPQTHVATAGPARVSHAALDRVRRLERGGRVLEHREHVVAARGRLDPARALDGRAHQPPDVGEQDGVPVLQRRRAAPWSPRCR